MLLKADGNTAFANGFYIPVNSPDADAEFFRDLFSSHIFSGLQKSKYAKQAVNAIHNAAVASNLGHKKRLHQMQPRTIL
jgi:hypothetical protein